MRRHAQPKSFSKQAREKSIFLFIIVLSCFFVISLFMFYHKIFFMNVTSNSMIPEFSENSLLIIEETEIVKKGDIIVFTPEWLPGKTVTHRLVGFTGSDFITKGDNNDYFDQTVSVSELKGKVLFSIPYLGVFLKNVFYFLYIIPLVVMFLFYKRFKKTFYSPRHSAKE